jgi:type IV secretory pathway VirB2 component (pilin)
MQSMFDSSILKRIYMLESSRRTLAVFILVIATFLGFGMPAIANQGSSSASGASRSSGTSAGADTALAKPLCKALRLVTGTPGKTICAIVVVVVALGGLFGKMSPTVIIITIACMGGIFSAETIVSFVSSEVSENCSVIAP